MLFDAAAVVTSVALGPVAEAFGVHEISRYSVVSTLTTSAISLPEAAMTPPIPFIGPEPSLSLGELLPVDPPAVIAGQPLQGTRLLLQLSTLGSGDIAEYVTAHPEAIAGLLETPPAPTEVASWWTSMDVRSQEALESASPQLVGNLDGIPFTIRDTANREVLSATMSDLETTIETDYGRTMIENARQQLKMLTNISDSLGTTGGPARTLMTLDVTGQGRAAIVIGDLETADYVSYLVPGMFFTIENQMDDWVDASSRLYDEQLSWLALLKGREAASAESVATIAWIGYHTPNLTNVGGMENAYEGRDSLAGAVEGLQALRSGNEPYVSVIAHSYGSTAAMMALAEYDFDIDALAVVGSPGSPAKSVADLHVRDENVFVGEAAWDPVPNSAYFGSDPGSDSYGAKPMGVSGGIDPLTGTQLVASTGHNAYFFAGTEAMRNFALIGIGEGQYVTTGETPAGPPAVG